MFITMIMALGLVSGIAAAALAVSGGKRRSLLKFFLRGREAKFTFREIRTLRRLALKCAVDDPVSVFRSQERLDICIRELVQDMRLSGSDEESQRFLSKLYDYRKEIELEKSHIEGISSTLQIEEGQPLRILVNGQGIFPSTVLRSARSGLTIAMPGGKKVYSGFVWRGIKLSIYFWRMDDAGYVFDTTVEDEVLFEGSMALALRHSEQLMRTQKRRNIRIKTHKAAFLYLMGNDTSPDCNIEVFPGLKCFIEDLSDSGCAVLIGGHAGVRRIKVQFILNAMPVCMSGTVRALDYNEEDNRSLLHVESDKLPLDFRNQILGEVFGMLPAINEDIHFLELEEELKNLSGDASIAPENVL